MIAILFFVPLVIAIAVVSILFFSWLTAAETDPLAEEIFQEEKLCEHAGESPADRRERPALFQPQMDADERRSDERLLTLNPQLFQ